MKKMSKCLAVNLSIILIAVIIVVIAVFMWTAYNPPQKLKEAAGTVSEWKNKDYHWTDSIGGGSGPYFNVRFDDGSFYEATGLIYDLINRDLFNNLKVGSTVTVIYQDRGIWAPNRIYGIELNGRTYLSSADALQGMRNESKGSQVYSPIVIGLTVVIATVLLIWYNIKDRHKEEV